MYYLIILKLLITYCRLWCATATNCGILSSLFVCLSTATWCSGECIERTRQQYKTDSQRAGGSYGASNGNYLSHNTNTSITDTSYICTSKCTQILSCVQKKPSTEVNTVQFIILRHSTA